MSATILVKVGRRFYKAKVNPLVEDPLYEQYARLMGAYIRQSKRKRLASMISIHRQILKLEDKLFPKKNPLIKSKDRSSVNKNITWLMHHPEELTAKTPEMKRKQAIAVSLSVWKRAMRRKRKTR